MRTTETIKEFAPVDLVSFISTKRAELETVLAATDDSDYMEVARIHRVLGQLQRFSECFSEDGKIPQDYKISESDRDRLLEVLENGGDKGLLLLVMRIKLSHPFHVRADRALQAIARLKEGVAERLHQLLGLLK